ncbi:DegT/DnrJ/EryC1/StrS family aminotransferase [Methylophilaceae bacterium]|nr:DegT/DnrJ/EryC1/StrS family aminotransferase [Methylophilaceae bacterium]
MMKKINVAQPSLAPLEEFIPFLEKIWDSKCLTNGGPFHNQLEEELCKYLGVNYISLFSSGTMALMTALKALNLSGEVITTPYSFIATSSSLSWIGINPVYVDINPSTFNIDPKKIEQAITPATTAILAVHCYGNPCEIEEIESIAHKNNLKVIYDAAHAFGINYQGQSLLNYGDLSVLSFHATKVFNTFEGGAIISKTSEEKLKIDRMKNFGYVDETTIESVGVNGKMAEINAAFGLLQLKYIDKWILDRKRIHDHYMTNIEGIMGISFLEKNEFSSQNYNYFPILVNDTYPLTRDELYEKLRINGFNARRYFYPLITDYPGYRSQCNKTLEIATQAVKKILCLPIYSALEFDQVDSIIKVISGK